MANADFTALTKQPQTELNVDFVSIPLISMGKDHHDFSAFHPVVLMGGEYDEALKMSVGRSVRLDPLLKVKA